MSWKIVTINDFSDLDNFSAIQKSMGDAYSKVDRDALISLFQRKTNFQIHIYKDANTEIILAGFYKPHNDKIKIAYGSVGIFVDIQTSMNIACDRIKIILQTTRKKGYAVVGETNISAKAVLWYSKISDGFKNAGLKFVKNGELWEFEVI